MKYSLILIPLISVLLASLDSEAQTGKKNPPDVVVLEHSWKLEEEWPNIRKTKYSWRAVVENRTDVSQKVAIYYNLLGENDYPLARNTAGGVIGPHETAEITSDSYVENGIISQIIASRADLKARPQ